MLSNVKIKDAVKVSSLQETKDDNKKDAIIRGLKIDLELVLTNLKQSNDLIQRGLYKSVISRHFDLYTNIEYKPEHKLYYLD